MAAPTSPPKGVTGSGYDGHYFWDTEIYVFPALLHTRPEIARKLLEFRHGTRSPVRASEGTRD